MALSSSATAASVKSGDFASSGFELFQKANDGMTNKKSV
jgi:hypothetical protein